MHRHSPINSGHGKRESHTQESNPELLDVSGVARLLGCSSRHVRRLADSGRMPRPVRLGALVRWPRAAVVEWIGSGCPSCDPRRKGGAR